MRVIYDAGANHGQNLPYYLLKANLVVAIEANPVLCDGIRSRYSEDIKAGKLLVVNCALVTKKESANEVDFYIHKKSDVGSQFLKPNEKEIVNFTKIRLPSKSLVDIIEEYGNPYYIKLDIENYDAIILSELFQNSIFPNFISAEPLASNEIVNILKHQGHYNCFKLVDGFSVVRRYKNKIIKNIDNANQTYSHPWSSAGPFGEDIDGCWMPEFLFNRMFFLEGPGWKDIHAKRVRKSEMNWIYIGGFLMILRYIPAYILKTIARIINKISYLISPVG